MPPRHAFALDERYVIRDDGCWEWLGCRDPNGYGRMYHPVLKRSYLAHRYFYERENGPVDATLDHLCRTPCCVNPGHLEPVTRQENVRRGKRAKLDWDKVRLIRSSGLSNKALAEMLGVSAPLICNVRAGRAWVEATRWP